ncbi:MAG: cadherin repeat domain-containing protein, partial [Eubacterium sp.]|nr:cadherin repeat domain-containing protein [Eubacterium sp.]
GSVTYAKVKGDKKLSINKNSGKITVKKGLKKGTYKLKVKVSAGGNANYKAGSKAVIIIIKIV